MRETPRPLSKESSRSFLIEASGSSASNSTKRERSSTSPTALPTGSLSRNRRRTSIGLGVIDCRSQRLGSGPQHVVPVALLLLSPIPLDDLPGVGEPVLLALGGERQLFLPFARIGLLDLRHNVFRVRGHQAMATIRVAVVPVALINPSFSSMGRIEPTGGAVNTTAVPPTFGVTVTLPAPPM